MYICNSMLFEYVVRAILSKDTCIVSPGGRFYYIQLDQHVFKKHENCCDFTPVFLRENNCEFSLNCKCKNPGTVERRVLVG